jgi:adenine-specific DNA-methyltransferase
MDRQRKSPPSQASHPVGIPQKLLYQTLHRSESVFNNRLIFGDNFLALKILEQRFIGNTNCIYIDPPYNTDGIFEHYNDWIELPKNK